MQGRLSVQYASNSRSMAAPHAATNIRALALVDGTTRGLNALAPLVDFAIRWIVAAVFFKSGLTKIASWETTIALFENEYAVPLLSPELAALLGTGVELIFPVLLVFGLGTRLSAFVLFVFNIVAVISYPGLTPAGLHEHQTWGLLLLVTLLHGPGALSLDHLVNRFVRGTR